jgi:TPR repeat protein
MQALAQYWIGLFYDQGRGVEKSHETAIQFLKASASNGNASAEFDLGSLYNNGAGGLAADKTQACQLFVKAADQGHVKAMHNAAFCYQTGVGVSKDLEAAKRYYTKAVEAGSTRSQHNLAMIYGEEGNADQAYFWLRVAQASGYAEKQELIDTAKAHLTAGQVDQEEKQVAAWMDAHKTNKDSVPAQ